MRKNSFKLWVTQQESCRIPKLIHCTTTFDILFVSVPLWSNITQICNARVNSGRSHCWAFSPEPQRASSHAQRHPTSQRIAVCDRWLQLQNQLIPVRREPDTSSSLTLICVTCSCGEDNIFSITPVVTCERIPHYSIYSCGFIFNSVTWGKTCWFWEIGVRSHTEACVSSRMYTIRPQRRNWFHKEPVWPRWERWCWSTAGA